MQVCMTCSDPGAYRLHSVGCTAEIRQIKRQDDGVLNIVAKGALNQLCPHLLSFAGDQLVTLLSIE